MKRFAIASLVFTLLAPLSYATPDQAVDRDETLLAEDDETFVVLRTERDNLGSYYASRTKVFLDERSKATGKTSKFSMLSDITTSIDANHDDPNTPAPVTKTVHWQDEKTLLGEVLTRYTLIPEQWRISATQKDKDKGFMGITVSPEGRIFYGSDQVIFDQDTVSKEVFGGRNAEVEVTLRATRQSGTSYYLKLVKDDDDLGGLEAHWVCVPPAAVLQLRAYDTMEEVYLSAGTFNSKEEALAQAAKWLELTREKKIHVFRPEIWSVKRGGGTKYLVVQHRSTDLIGRDEKAVVEQLLGIRLEPVKSESFQEWTRVPSVN